MRCILVLLAAMLAFGAAPTNAGDVRKLGQRVADGSDACLLNCSSDNASCKRTCPTTFNGSCISACDSQAQFCAQNCQRK
jgi:hypothetical protein